MTVSQPNGVPVWVYVEDIDTHEELTGPTILSGMLGENYQVQMPHLPAYKLIQNDGDLNGQFTNATQSVRLFMRRADWAETQVINSFVQVKEPTPLFDETDGEPTGEYLQPDTVAKTTFRVATTQGKFWYNVGERRWVEYDRHNVDLRETSRTDAQIAAELVSPSWETTQVQQNAVIDFVPDQYTAVYSSPYGRIIGEIRDGAQVQISEIIDDPSGVDWYQLTDIGWVTSLYVKLV
ncbi:hypothetical protein EQG49_09285 [Periweissella cryptocerci]|uniref:MucBP domain-containing protein n=1 Tax=Periweissella cryptocerci TaxID=2506420 RepID=A0A4P6YV16_9LACO|nr:MucBP domain-containing protein [Periweissella cryptocerci]QBO36649.1 hypothetical protein EQG49_09285 [Periweissella cryptocerci]